MHEQIAVVYEIHAPLFDDKADVRLQFGGVEKLLPQEGDDRPFLLCQRSLRIKRAVRHIEFGMRRDHRVFQLQLDHRDRLVQLCQTVVAVKGNVRIISVVDAEGLAGVVRVSLRRVRAERAEIDAVAALENLKIAVRAVDADDIRDARGVSARGADPQEIVVSPLNIQRMIAHQPVDDDVRAVAAVEDIPHDVQMIDRKALNQLAHGDDEGIRIVQLDDG